MEHIEHKQFMKKFSKLVLDNITERRNCWLSAVFLEFNDEEK